MRERREERGRERREREEKEGGGEGEILCFLYVSKCLDRPIPGTGVISGYEPANMGVRN